MLSEVRLDAFKCFDQVSVPLRPLTLLAGHNGGGKSSILQAIVLLAQTMRSREWGRGLLLETQDLALGTAADVINQRTARKLLALGLSADGEDVTWTFKAGDRRALVVELHEVRQGGAELSLDGAVRWLLPEAEACSSKVVAALLRLSWISAERSGPRELLPLRDPESHFGVGSRGELSAGLLYWHEDERVTQDLCLDGVPPTLFNQVRARMQTFFPGCDLRVTPVDGASAVSLGLRTNAASDFQRPQNVGFGLTQLFPVVVALLSARRDDIILVENPEVHLHPKAQQDIGLLIAQLASSGVQVIVETHSDHVLNGIRLAVKSKAVESADVAVHFFGAPQPSGEVTMSSPAIDADGRLSSWPEGFFDQFDQALSQLL
jgi:predicted ATPase